MFGPKGELCRRWAISSPLQWPDLGHEPQRMPCLESNALKMVDSLLDGFEGESKGTCHFGVRCFEKHPCACIHSYMFKLAVYVWRQVASASLQMLDATHEVSDDVGHVGKQPLPSRFAGSLELFLAI